MRRAPGKRYRHRGITKTLPGWADHLGIKPSTLHGRINRLMRRDGVSRDEAIAAALDHAFAGVDGLKKSLAEMSPLPESHCQVCGIRIGAAGHDSGCSGKKEGGA